MRRVLWLSGAVILAAAAALWWVKFERRIPEVTFQGDGDVVGRQAAWDLVVRAPGWPGLRRVDVRLQSGGLAYQLFAEEYPPLSWLGSRLAERAVRVDADLAAAGVREGPAVLQVFVETYAWHLIPPRRGAIAERPVTVDLTPPGVELLTIQHNVRLGGASVALFRTTPDAARASVAVADYSFPATRGYFTDPNVAVVLFAVPQDLAADVRPRVEVTDAVGNSRQVELPCRIRDRRFPERTLNIDDQFLNRKVPEILANNHLPPQTDLVQGYLFINRELRRRSEVRLREITAASAAEPLWDGAFRRHPNAAPMSGFADRRSYLYGGELIDRQTHLGYDLASLQRAPVDAAQNGVVVFADNLGIYGNAVIVDHGLGLFSLYAHLSTMAVQAGQRVRAGDRLGQTGETGLAGGDHLHFSLMVHGTHVDPVEWWDPKWIRDHVTTKLTMLPVAASAAPAPSGLTEAVPHDQARP